MRLATFFITENTLITLKEIFPSEEQLQFQTNLA